MDFKYSTATSVNRPESGSSLYGAGGPFGLDSLAVGAGQTQKLGSTQDTTGGLYGAGRFGYTINDQSATGLTGNLATASIADINYDLTNSVLSASIAAGTARKVSVALSGLTNPDYSAVRSWGISGSGVTYHPQYSAVVGANAVFIATGVTATGSLPVSVFYNSQPTAENRGDFEDRGNPADIGIPEIELELKSEPIVAKTRKLKAIWTPELAQDLNAYHSIDAEAELTQMLSEYISLEIDLEILEMLQANALTTDYWSARVGYDYTPGAGFTVDSTAVAAGAYNKSTWFQTLGIKLQKVSNRIHQLTMRGGANFIVASPNVCTILESMNGFASNPAKDALQFAAGVSQVGSISNRYDVYKNPYMTENVILLGFKGSNFFETGAVYAPYVPLIMTPLVYDPINFTPRRGVMTRYAKKIVRPEFYGKIIVDGINTL